MYQVQAWLDIVRVKSNFKFYFLNQATGQIELWRALDLISNVQVGHAIYINKYKNKYLSKVIVIKINFKISLN